MPFSGGPLGPLPGAPRSPGPPLLSPPLSLRVWVCHSGRDAERQPWVPPPWTAPCALGADVNWSCQRVWSPGICHACSFTSRGRRSSPHVGCLGGRERCPRLGAPRPGCRSPPPALPQVGIGVLLVCYHVVLQWVGILSQLNTSAFKSLFASKENILKSEFHILYFPL